MKKVLIDDERLILRVCNMHYNQDMSQSDIAKVLHVSRPTVAKILKKAKDLGIVTITISDPSGRKYYELEQELEDILGLKEVFIADTDENIDITRNNVGKGAAQLLNRLVKNSSTIGISLGYTLASIIPNVQEKFLPNTTFIPLVGGFDNMPQEIQGNTLAEKLANKFSGRSLSFYSPVRIVNETLRKELLDLPSVKKLFKTGEKMDIAIIGIGGTDEKSTVLSTGYISKEQHEELVKEGVVGDTCIQFFDINGQIDKYDINKEILTFNLDKLRSVDHVLGVGFGDEKVDAIIGSIRGKMINTLITDFQTAQLIKEKLGDQSNLKFK